MRIAREAINRKNLKFLLKPRTALALVRGRVPDTEEFRAAMERAKEEINNGFSLMPEHLETLHTLTGASRHAIGTYFEDLKSNDRFYSHLKSNIIQYGCYAGIEIDTFAPVYYVLTRITKPRAALETGVANGISTSFILQGLEDNGRGSLYSIDVPGLITKPNATSGWLVPDWLRHRWYLTIGRSAKNLIPILKKIGQTDFFVSDSAHYYKNEMFEFSAAWQFLREGGVLGCDDITYCTALKDFSQKMGAKMATFEAQHQRHSMGFVRKGTSA